MKKSLFFSVIVGLVSGGAAFATDVDVIVDNATPTRYVLDNLVVSSSGTLTLSVISGAAAPVDATYPLTITPPVGGTITPDKAAPYTCSAGACPDVVLTAAAISADYTFSSWGGDCLGQVGLTCSLKMSRGRIVSATFISNVTPPVANACNPAGTTLVDVATKLPAMNFPRTDYHPTPTTVYAFAFKTPAAGDAQTGILSAAQLSSSLAGKLAVVSECRGDISTAVTADKTSGCYRFGAEASNVPYIVNNPLVFKPAVYCNLKPNTQYYYNVVPRQTTDGAPNCTSTVNCGFSFQTN